MMRRAAAALAVLTLIPATPILAVTCEDRALDGVAFTACTVTAGEDLRLFNQGPDGPYGGFSAVDEALAPAGAQLAFAMNAGMFDPDYAPLGLYVEDRVEQQAIVTSDGPGNFGLLPNGVFCMTEAGDSGPTFQVTETRAFAADPPACRIATQSGPMLVLDGALHPRFKAGSDSLYYRNGVGVSPDGTSAVFVISGAPVNFHLFARMFRDGLGVEQALYLDGSISRLHAPMMGRSDAGFPLGTIIGVVEPLPPAGN